MANVTISSARPAKPLLAEALEGDLIQEGHSLFGLIWINPERVSGAPCFAGTRVPIKNLFDYLESNYTVDQFLDDFDGVTREQAVGIIELAQAGLLAELPPAVKIIFDYCVLARSWCRTGNRIRGDVPSVVTQSNNSTWKPAAGGRGIIS